MRRVVATILSAVLVVLVASVPAAGAGSGDMLPTAAATCEAGGECRPAIEWRTGHYGPTWATGIPRRTLLSVYASAGEQILLGSSSLPATGAGSSDIVVWDPEVVPDPQAQTLPAPQFSCVAQRRTSSNGTRGFIADRAEELAGAEAVNGSGNTSGYRPCYYTAPTTGVYRVAFYGTAGGAANNETGPTGDIAPTGAFGLLPTAVNAWDVTVRPAAPSSTADASGRVFTYVYAGFTGNNPRPVSMTMYLTTLDGFRYRVDTNGFDPNGFVFYGNREGFLDSDGTPLNRDIVPDPESPNQQTLSKLLGGVAIAPPEYPLSLEPLAPETLAALGVPTAPSAPVVSAISYAGQVTSRGSYVGRGGEFTFTSGTAGTYEIVLSRAGNFDPGLATNRVLRGVVDAAGTYTVAWDGLDNALDDFPVGQDFEYAVTLRGGEYHAPMIDVESSVRGGPSITLENPPGGRCPFSGVVSNGTNCTRAFYDDRAYVTANGTQIGDPVSGQLCSALKKDDDLPLTTFADPATGFDSAGKGRAFGTTERTNVNVACKDNDASTLGDARGLDLWTYFPSSRIGDVLDVLPLPAVPVADDDAYSTDAGTTLTVPAGTGVLDGDTGSGPSATVLTPPASGTLDLAADGSFDYIPPTGFSGVVTFDYTLTDDAGQTDVGKVTVTVRPTGADDSGTVAVGGVLTVAGPGLLTNDVGTGLAIRSATQPPHGTVTTTSDGGYTYTPTAGYSGSDEFTYTAADSGGRTYTRTVDLTVTPTAADDAFTTTAHTAVDGDVLGNDRGSLEIVATTEPAHGEVEWHAEGDFTYTPDDGWSGVDTFTYTVDDGVSAQLTRTVTVTVTPTAAADSGTTPVDVPLVVTTAGNLLANDLGALRVDIVTVDPEHGTVTVTATGEYTYEPDAGWSGDDTFVYQASDPTGATVTATVTVRVTPTAADDSTTTTVGTAVTVAADDGLLANDAGALAVTAVTQPAQGQVALVGTAGSYTYTPPAGWSGTTTFTYTASDGVTPLTRTVTVTVVPTAAADSYTTFVDTSLELDAAHGVLANDAGALTVTEHTQPARGTVDVEADGSLTFVPPAGWSGSTTFTYTASDGTTPLTRTVTIVVTPDVAPDSGTTPAGTPLVVADAGVLANDAGSLTVTAATVPANGTVTVAATGGYTYTPTAGFSGVDTFIYTASDGVSAAKTATVTIVVTPVGADDAGTTPVDTALIVPASGGLLQNDLGTLAVTTTTVPDHGTAVVEPDGAYTYTPPAGWSGTTEFTYTASDGVTDRTQDVVLTVVPTALDDTAAVAVDGVLTVPTASGLLANDRGTLQVVTTSPPGHGTVVAAPDGSWTYTPARGWSGTDTFTYDATDGTTTLRRTVTVRVTPVAADDVATLAAGAPLTLPASQGVLANDAGDLTVTAWTQPADGRVTVAPDGGYTYTPPPGWSGRTTFTYTATDGAGHDVTRVATLTVVPDAVDDAYTTGAGTPLTVPAARGVLGNDTGALTVTSHTQPAHGRVDVHPDGSLTYTPAPGRHGTVTFTYTASDGANPAVTRTVTVTVEPARPTSGAGDDTAPGRPGEPTVLRPLDNDPPGDGLTWVPGSLVLVDPTTGTTGRVVDVPGQGRWEVVDGDAVRFTPVDGFVGTAAIGYRVTDDSGRIVAATMTARYDHALAVTGAQPGAVALLAALLVAGGLVLVVVRRRVATR